VRHYFNRNELRVTFRHHRLLKILHQRKGSSQLTEQNRLLATYELPTKERIHNIAILPNEYLFVADESSVFQFRLGQCALYTECHSCAWDPYCSWNIARSECFPQETVHSTAVGWITDLSAAEKQCHTYRQSSTRTLYPGDSAVLQCPAATLDKVEWRVDRVPVSVDGIHRLLAADGSLVLLNVTKEEAGAYQCFIDNVASIEHTVRIDDENCTRPKTVEQFHSLQREWCRKFDNYRSIFRNGSIGMKIIVTAPE
jgi:hypothetical protein